MSWKLFPLGPSDDQARPLAPPLARMMIAKIISIVTPIAVSVSRTRADIWMPKYERPRISRAPRAAQKIQFECRKVAPGATNPKKF